MRVLIREAAYGDLERIYAWIATARPRSAAAVLDRILEGAERLGQLPYIGHAGIAPGTHEWVIPGLPCILVYQIREDQGLVVVTASSTVRKIDDNASGPMLL